MNADRPSFLLGSRPPADPAMREAVLLGHVRRIARIRGWLVYHTHRSDRSEPGWPDLVFAHPLTGRFLVVELKATKGRLTPDQRTWIDVLRACGLDVRVWRPADLDTGEIDDALNPYTPPRVTPPASAPQPQETEQ